MNAESLPEVVGTPGGPQLGLQQHEGITPPRHRRRPQPVHHPAQQRFAASSSHPPPPLFPPEPRLPHFAHSVSPALPSLLLSWDVGGTLCGVMPEEYHTREGGVWCCRRHYRRGLQPQLQRAGSQRERRRQPGVRRRHHRHRHAARCSPHPPGCVAPRRCLHVVSASVPDNLQQYSAVSVDHDLLLLCRWIQRRVQLRYERHPRDWVSRPHPNPKTHKNDLCTATPQAQAKASVLSPRAPPASQCGVSSAGTGWACRTCSTAAAKSPTMASMTPGSRLMPCAPPPASPWSSPLVPAVPAPRLSVPQSLLAFSFCI